MLVLGTGNKLLTLLVTKISYKNDSRNYYELREQLIRKCSIIIRLFLIRFKSINRFLSWRKAEVETLKTFFRYLSGKTFVIFFPNS